MKTCVFFIAYFISFAVCSQIIFPRNYTVPPNSCFLSQEKKYGKCVIPQDCRFFKRLAKKHKYSDILCRSDNAKLICCPETLDEQSDKPIDISTPTSAYPDCGFPYYPASPLKDFYRANDTANELENQGYTISELEMDFGDKLFDFRFSNETYSNTFNEHFGFDKPIFGGVDADRVVTVYMALIGKQRRGTNSIDWHCDGVLINFEWVLTAAHCFVSDLDTVRLGEYNLTTTEPSDFEDPQDYGIKKVVMYPKYVFPAAYHDLALVQLSRKTYVARQDINPICLPWGAESEVTLVNKQVTLTGFGATIFGGPISKIVQEVNITVFDLGRCDREYSTLRDYTDKFPSGMHSHPLLCAGDEAGGKDACQGDSGAPAVYLSDNERYTLAGIVSVGHGCGIKEFPGVYTPTAIPEYLNWIKTTAF